MLKSMDSSLIDRMSLHSTDALPNREIERIDVSPTSINAQILDQLEQELEEFEKISILFLISAEYPWAYEKIMSICNNVGEQPNIITEFVQRDFDQWSERLLEALCIIDNQEILKNLGFNPANVATRYHYNIPRMTVRIHVISKVLYRLFEIMDSTKGKLLLRDIYNEHKVASPLQDTHYLELHALYWLQTKFITVSPNGKGDLSKLAKHLKKDYYTERIYQDVVYFSTSYSQSDSCFPGNFISNGCLEAPQQNDTVIKDLSTYSIKKGSCIIFNEVNFPKNVRKELEYEKREGSDKDRDDLRRTFLGLGFDVEHYDDLTEDEIFKRLKNVSDNFNVDTHDCLVVCILSHGFEGGIISSDGHEILISAIEDAIFTERLRKVFKILIIQACQGKITGDVSPNLKLALDGPRTENILRFIRTLTFISTINRYNSIRHKENGSWFIQAICEVLSQENQRISVSKWCIAVTKKVRSKVGHVNKCRNASQIPERRDRFEEEVYFPLYKEKATTNATVLQ